VSENLVPKRIFGPKKEKITRGMRKLHNGELYTLYSSSNIIRKRKWRMRWAKHVAHMGEIRNACKMSAGKAEDNRHLERAGHKWEDNIRNGYQRNNV
jgi:hypothetical protein